MDEYFFYNGKFYTFKKDISESKETYIERVWYILNNLKNNESIEKLESESRIWSNEKNLGCKF